ncbi:MAG: FAD-binding protein, partial [Cellulomonadaceae bacterium]|jgi:succinate dehydrogenase / fumarate reductase flavoprotein subunit|nr:FAD-binding protein [Cellulomonadaceae bacterium]
VVLDLEHRGLPFNRMPDGRIDQRKFGGHTRDHGKAPVQRACYAADRTGHMILQTLFQSCIKQGVEFFNEFYVLDLLTTGSDDGAATAGVSDLDSTPATNDAPTSSGEVTATGVVAYDLATGEIHVFRAKSVIFCTGGAGKVFKTTSNAHTLTGDGMALAYRRGIPLEDMEFFQFHPTGLYGLGILLSEAARGEGGILRNASGQAFMANYAPTIKDLAPRDIVARAIASEVRAGRGCGPNKDYVHLDITHLPRDVIDAKLPDITEFARTYLGIEPYTDPVPTYPTAHYTMGGIPTTVRGEVLSDSHTVVRGLYAAGECACVSVHGANRLGTNSLLDTVVFGRRAGQAAAEYALAQPDAPVEPAARDGFGAATDVAASLDDMRTRSGGEPVAELRKALQQTMDTNAAVFRTDESLRQASSDIRDLRQRYAKASITDKGRIYNTDLLEAIELGFLLDIAEVAVLAARGRRESRGGHYREDYPSRDDVNYLHHTMAYRRPLDATDEVDGQIPGFFDQVEQMDGYKVVIGSKPVTMAGYQPMERTY